MTFNDDQKARDASLLDPAIFGEEISYQQEGCVPKTITAIFFDPFDEIVPRSMPAESSDPMVTVTRSDVPDPKPTDEFIIKGKAYSIKEKQPDEGELMPLILEEKPQ